MVAHKQVYNIMFHLTRKLTTNCIKSGENFFASLFGFFPLAKLTEQGLQSVVGHDA